MRSENVLVEELAHAFSSHRWSVKRRPAVSGWFADLEAIGPNGERLLVEVKSGASIGVPDVLRLASMNAGLPGRHPGDYRTLSWLFSEPRATAGAAISTFSAIMVVDDPSTLSSNVVSSANANGIAVIGRPQVERVASESSRHGRPEQPD